jgi:tetratricopeptide (TPR) repeat protein
MAESATSEYPAVSPERWQRARALFDTASQRTPAEADEFLRAECADDDGLLTEIRRMLEEHRHSSTLDRPVFETSGKPPSTAPVFAAGQLVAGRYRIVRYLNCGGMGEVYEAEHPLLPERVALKTLLPAIASDEAMIERFKLEIQLARRVAHPNVCKVFDLEWHQAERTAQAVSQGSASQGTGPATDQGAILFLTMELLEGETLSSRIQNAGRITAADALPLIEQMAEALDAAHRSGVIHRDFKPSNVMLVPSRQGTRVVVTDFGLARGIRSDSESTATLTKHVAGTLDYMAPELLTGTAASVRSDNYALGMVAYKMMAGALPFGGESPWTGALLRSQKRAPSPRALAADLDPKWEHAILRAIDRDPRRRFAQALEFPRALRGEAVSAAAALPVLTRRNALAGAGAAVVLAAGWIGWRAWSERRNHPSLEAERLYRLGVDDIHAGAYFAATKALGRAVQLAPHFSLARTRLAESWLELDLPETALRELLRVGHEDNSTLSTLDQLQIDAVDRTITREFAVAASKYEAMRQRGGADAAGLDIDLGRVYEKAIKFDLAIEAYRRAAEGPMHSAAAWLRLGVLYSQRKRVAESEKAFVEAERSYRESSNFEGLTELTLQRGVAANRNNRYSEAAVLLRQAMDRAHDVGNLQQEIAAKLTLANVSFAAGDANLAQSLARDALATAQANQMESLTIRGFINLGSAYQAKGDLTGAEQQFQQALALALRTGSLRFAAQSRLNLASLHDRLHRSEEQIAEAKDALAYYQPNHWVRETFGCLLLIGRGEKYRGNYAAALDSFQRLLGEATKAQDKANISQAEESLGDVLATTENYPRALEHYLGFKRASVDSPRAGYAVRDCGLTLAMLGRYAEAAPEFAKAEAAAAVDAALHPSVERCRAEIALSRNQFKEAIGCCKSALASIPNLNPIAAADLTRLLGLGLLRSADRKAGLQKCSEAYTAARQLNDPAEIRDTSLALLEARLAARDSTASLDIFHDLEPTLSDHPESRWRALALMARSDRQYVPRAKQAGDQLETLWGREAMEQYRKRPDVQELSRPLLQGNAANH